MKGGFGKHSRRNRQQRWKEARAKIEELTGLRRSLSQIRTFMKKIGLKLRKVAQIPVKADVEKQRAFLQQELTPR